MNPSPPFKSGYAAIAGKPNAGKSTLMNRLLDCKLSIVSPKPQTTRHRVLGIRNGKNHQIVFLDTPGLIDPKYPLQSAMVRTANQTIQESDLILFLVDVSAHVDPDSALPEIILGTNKPKILLLNKIDLVPKPELLPLMDRFQRTGLFREIVPVSALKRDGLDLLLPLIVQTLPETPPLYPTDILSEHPERFFVSEIIRERIFHEYGEEIPYSCAVQIAEFSERPGRKDFVRAEIIVERDSQKGILIGSNGRSLKKLGTDARGEIERFLGRPVFLELFVRVEKNWRRNEKDIQQFGYS